VDGSLAATIPGFAAFRAEWLRLSVVTLLLFSRLRLCQLCRGVASQTLRSSHGKAEPFRTEGGEAVVSVEG